MLKSLGMHCRGCVKREKKIELTYELKLENK
jgi:hypothetical protein